MSFKFSGFTDFARLPCGFKLVLSRFYRFYAPAHNSASVEPRRLLQRAFVPMALPIFVARGLCLHGLVSSNLFCRGLDLRGPAASQPAFLNSAWESKSGISSPIRGGGFGRQDRKKEQNVPTAMELWSNALQRL